VPPIIKDEYLKFQQALKHKIEIAQARENSVRIAYASLQEQLDELEKPQGEVNIRMAENSDRPLSSSMCGQNTDGQSEDDKFDQASALDGRSMVDMDRGMSLKVGGAGHVRSLEGDAQGTAVKTLNESRDGENAVASVEFIEVIAMSFSPRVCV
jgi:hypothetical protein